MRKWVDKLKWKKIVQNLLRLSLVVLIVCLALVIGINIPAVQSFLAGKVIKGIREKSGTAISLKSVAVALPNSVLINNLYVQDLKGDTLICMESLKVKVGLFKLLRNQLSVYSAELDNAVIHLTREDTAQGYNYQYLVDYFVKSGEREKSDTADQVKTIWHFDVEEILLNQLHFTFKDHSSGIDLGIDLEKFHAKVDKIDLSDQLISIQEVLLKNATIKFARSLSAGRGESHLAPGTIPEPLRKGDAKQQSRSYFPDWNISLHQLSVEGSNFMFDQQSDSERNHLSIHQLNAAVQDIKLSEQGVRSVIDQISFEEGNGLKLKKLKGEIELTKEKVEIQNLQLATSFSEILGDGKIEYSNLESLTSDIGNCHVSIDLKRLKLAASDLLLFVPGLSGNKYFKALASSGLLLSGNVNGRLNDLSIGGLDLSILKETRLQLNGKIKGLPEYKRSSIDATIDRLSTSRGDLFQLVDPNAFKGVNIPHSMNLTGRTIGTMDSFRADATMATSFGKLTAAVFYSQQAVANRDSFEVDFSVNNLNAGAIIGDSLAGRITATGKVAGSGSGFALNSLSCSAGLHILEAEYNNYTYSNLKADGRIYNGLVNVNASSMDSALKFNLAADADLRDPRMKFTTRLDLLKLDLQALKFSKSKLDFQTNLSAKLDFTDHTSAESTVEMNNTQLSGETKAIPLKLIHLHALSEEDSLNFHVQSDLADLNMSGKINPKNLAGIFQSAYKKYLGLPDAGESFPESILYFQATVKSQNIIKGYFPALKNLDIKRLNGSYKGVNNQLNINAEITSVVYDKLHLDSLRLSIHGENDSLSMDFGLAKMAYDSLVLRNLRIKEKVKGGLIISSVQVNDQFGKPKYRFANEIDYKPELYKIRFLPEGLTLNGTPWRIEKENLLQFENGFFTAQQFSFKNGNQSLELQAMGNTKKLRFSEFELSNISNILSFKGKENLINGLLSGEVALTDEGELPLVNADILISQFAMLDSVMGKLSCELKMTREKLDVNAKLEDNQNNISLIGQINQLSGTPNLDLKALLRINEPHHFERLSLGYVSEVRGKISGDLAIRGTTAKPDIDGYLSFYNTIFNINSLNLQAKLANERLQIDGKGIHLNDFIVEDARQKRLILNGDLLTNNSNSLNYNLHIEAKDFQPMNSTSADNPVFFGILNMDNDIRLTGELRNPKIEADVKINSSTNLTLVMPGDELKLVSSEGIVKFRNASNLSDTVEIAKQADYVTDSIISKLSGIDLRMNLEVSPDAKFRLDINPKSGDYLAISGSAKLNVSTNTSGSQSITGVFEVKKGDYQLSFFGLVKKSFSILPGSTVSWSGRPMEAEVELTAGYSVRSSSVALMSNETSGMSEAEKNAFKERLPYEVKLHIRGFPAKPDIRFEIDLPDKYLAENPLIATKLEKLNSDEKTSELNKQVFALLVTGGFIADSSADPSAGSSATSIATTAARNSVNGILADQMNNFSSRYINNVDVNFGLTSYENYGGGSSDIRTDLDIQLSKKMFNNRLTVEAQGSFDLSGDKKSTGTSTEKTNGEVGVIYQLTKNNEFKVKVYYKNIYDMFEGELTCSGLALIHEKEYDSLRKKKNQEKARKRFIDRNFK